MQGEIIFSRLSNIKFEEIQAHMNDPRIADHLPLLDGQWNDATTRNFVTSKEDYWERDGLGHWAFLHNGKYIGWGGFQKEGNEWDFGLVLTADAFGMGPRISKQAISFAQNDPRIAFITFLLPPTRTNLGALTRMGAALVGTTDYDGHTFLKYRMETNL